MSKNILNILNEEIVINYINKKTRLPIKVAFFIIYSPQNQQSVAI